MQIAMIGLGRMGANMSRRLMRAGHECVVYDVNKQSVEALEKDGSEGACSYEELVQKLKRPRSIWMMVPAGIVDKVIDGLMPLLEPDDVLIDGGNSYYVDDIRRARHVKEKGLHYVDAGTSGGVFGLERGYCLMIGGEEPVVKRLDLIFAALAPGESAAARTEDKAGPLSTAEKGYLHCGPNGAGHFVKMVHNGIEYGIMAAYAEGLNVLKNADIGKRQADISAEISPLRDPEYYQYDFDVAQVAEVWRRGSVISSWLLDLTAHALSQNPDLSVFGGRVSDSGEGRWTIHAAVDEGVPVPVLTSALFERFSSRGAADFADRLLSAMRFEFGGHLELEEHTLGKDADR
jgi:6-phosphogluconate dehydrogenase